MKKEDDSLDINKALEGVDEDIEMILAGTLDDAINEMIDGVLKKIRIYDDSIDTNGQVKKLIIAKIIQPNKLNEFIDTLSQYNPSIIEAIQELTQYLKSVEEGDRKKSDSLREQIEKILADNSSSMTFTEMIDAEFEKVLEWSRYFKAIKSIEDNKDFLELAYSQGKIPPRTLGFFKKLHDIMLFGNDEDKAILEDFLTENIAKEIKKYIADVKNASYKETINLPEGLQTIKNRLYQIKSIEDKLPDKLSMLFERYGIDVNALIYLKEQYPDYRDLSLKAFLALLGKQIETGEKVSDKEVKIIRNLEKAKNKSTDGWDDLYKEETEIAASILERKPEQRDTDFVNKLKQQYAEAKEKSNFYSKPLEEIQKQISEPVQDKDSMSVAELKKIYKRAPIDREITEILSQPTDEVARILSEPIQEGDSYALKQLKTQYLYTMHGIENSKERNSIFNKSAKEFEALLSSEINPEDSEYLKELKFRYAVDRAGVEREFNQIREHELKVIFNRTQEELEQLLSETPNDNDSRRLRLLKFLFKHDRGEFDRIHDSVKEALNEELKERNEKGR